MKKTKEDFRIIAVNDGSKDNTANVVKSYLGKIPLTFIDFAENKGPGEVFRAGFNKALEFAKADDLIVSMESDNTSDLSILPKMIEKIERGNDIALASCYAAEGKIIQTPLHRKILSGGANAMLSFFFPIKGIHTYSSFYRVYRVSSFKKVLEKYGDRLFEEKGFVCVVDMLIKFKKTGLKIAEVPMVLNPSIRKGKSGMKVLKTMKDYLRLVAKEWLK